MLTITYLPYLVGSLVLAALMQAQLAHLVVFEEAGCIMLTVDGQKQKLTSSGRDYDPTITKDGRTITFCRMAPDKWHAEVYQLGLPSRQELLVFDKPLKWKGAVYQNYAEPQVDPSKQTLYLEVGAPVNGGVFAINLRSQRVRFVTDAMGFLLVTVGPRAGNLVVAQRLWQSGFYQRDVWFCRPDGRHLIKTTLDSMEGATLEDNLASAWVSWPLR